MRSKEKIAKFMKSLYTIKENQYFWGALALLYVVAFFRSSSNGPMRCFQSQTCCPRGNGQFFCSQPRWVMDIYRKRKVAPHSTLYFVSDLDFVRPLCLFARYVFLENFPGSFPLTSWTESLDLDVRNLRWERKVVIHGTFRNSPHLDFVRPLCRFSLFAVFEILPGRFPFKCWTVSLDFDVQNVPRKRWVAREFLY